MPNSNNTLYLDKFYPEKDLKITDIILVYEKYTLNTWVKTLMGEIVLNNYIGDYDINSLYFEGFDN